MSSYYPPFNHTIYNITNEVVVKFRETVEGVIHQEIKNLCGGYRIEYTLNKNETLAAITNAIPQKVTFIEHENETKDYYCPVCHRSIDRIHSGYCSHCGKKLTWEET